MKINRTLESCQIAQILAFNPQAMRDNIVEAKRQALEDLGIANRLLAAIDYGDSDEFFAELLEPFGEDSTTHDGIATWLIETYEESPELQNAGGAE